METRKFRVITVRTSGTGCMTLSNRYVPEEDCSIKAVPWRLGMAARSLMWLFCFVVCNSKGCILCGDDLLPGFVLHWQA